MKKENLSTWACPCPCAPSQCVCVNGNFVFHSFSFMWYITRLQQVGLQNTNGHIDWEYTVLSIAIKAKVSFQWVGNDLSILAVATYPGVIVKLFSLKHVAKFQHYSV